jgi:3-oxoadipate enol-lactonase / 4-carboxymuconolactone decarboxylase
MEASAGAGVNRLHYRVDGPDAAPPVLLINSLGTNLDLWSPQVEAWSPHLRVIRYDTRGHGKSGVPPGEYTLDQLGADAIRILDAVGVESAHVCGISLGGVTAMWLGVRHPQRVRSLVIANTAAKVGTPQRWAERIGKVRSEGMTAVANMIMPAWFSPAFRERQPETVARFHEMVATTDPDGYVGCCAALRDGDLREEIGRIRRLALVIAGDQDTSTTVADAEAISFAIPGSTMLTLNAAHLTNVECAEAFSRHAGASFQASGGQSAGHSLSEGERMRRRILGNAHVDRAIEHTTQLNAEFQDLITRYVWGEIWTRPGLDQRTRRVLVLGTMIALARWEEFAMHVRAAVAEGGFTAGDIKEIILQQAVYCGVPAANHALGVAAKILDDLTPRQA